jgi:acetaldehyde/propanal dehydrogenase
MKKIQCALIGPGNIGTDLLAKLQHSPVLEPVWMVGIEAMFTCCRGGLRLPAR